MVAVSFLLNRESNATCRTEARPIAILAGRGHYLVPGTNFMLELHTVFSRDDGLRETHPIRCGITCGVERCIRCSVGMRIDHIEGRTTAHQPFQWKTMITLTQIAMRRKPRLLQIGDLTQHS